MTTPPIDHTVNAHGLDLHYLDWGNPGAPPVLLLHGLQDSAALWGTFAEAMRRARTASASGKGLSETMQRYRVESGGLRWCVACSYA